MHISLTCAKNLDSFSMFAFDDLSQSPHDPEHKPTVITPFMHQRLREEMTYLGVRFYDVVRLALRHGNPSDVSMFFGLPQGQMAYVMDGMMGERAARLSGMGLPYLVDSSSIFDLGKIALPDGFRGQSAVGEAAPQWHSQALDLLVDHWWIVRGWAQKDPGMTALITRTKSPLRIDAIASMAPGDVRDVANATFNSIRMDSSMPMQLSHLFADAQAAHDRIAVVMAGRGICAPTFSH